MAVSEASPLLYNQVLRCASSDGIANLALTSGTAQAVIPPVGARAASFSFSADIWVVFGTSAVAQTFSTYSSAGSSLAQVFNPTFRYFTSTISTTAISVISEYTCKGSIEFFK